jgi:LacI family transcriptional regulator, galactose operon repressor
MADTPHVALVVETATIYGRRILQGVTRYLHAHRPWSVYLEQHDLNAAPPRWLSRWRGDGVITRSPSRTLAAAIRRRGLAAVDLSDRKSPVGMPRINSDDGAVGRLAADHLRDRGLMSLAFCGFTGELWSARRLAGFRAAVAERGLPCPTFATKWAGPNIRPWESEQAAIRDWLRSLPRPVGVMACNDMRGQHVLDACQRAGLRVPDEVTVIGVDDDEVLCELSTPPLSSVVPNPERIGYDAAALLDRLMAGGKPERAETFVEPLRVAARLSSDVLAIEDPAVAAAVRFVREHACRGIGVEDVLRAVPVSRTFLERQFRHHLGRSPHAEIRAAQLARVRRLLAETELKLSQIAERTGFTHPEYLSVVFKATTGESPGQYRRSVRVGRQ